MTDKDGRYPSPLPQKRGSFNSTKFVRTGSTMAPGKTEKPSLFSKKETTHLTSQQLTDLVATAVAKQVPHSAGLGGAKPVTLLVARVKGPAGGAGAWIGGDVAAESASNPNAASSLVYGVAVVMEENVHPSGYVARTGTVYEAAVNAIKATVVLQRSWSINALAAAERTDKEGAGFMLAFEGGGGALLTWETTSAAAVKELMWVILALARVVRGTKSLSQTLISASKDIDSAAVFEGFATSHPYLSDLLKTTIAQNSTSATGGSGRRGSLVAVSSTNDVGSNNESTGDGGGDGAPDESEKGGIVLQRLGWKDKGQEGLMEELVNELEELEGSTIPQLIVWSETEDCAARLCSILDDIDDELAVMEGWLEGHGRPLEVMKREMTPIESKNNLLDVEWCNFGTLQEHLATLIDCISLDAEDEAALKDASVHLEINQLQGDLTVEQVVAASEALQVAVAGAQRLVEDDVTNTLQFVMEGRNKLRNTADTFITSITMALRRVFHKLMGEACGKGESSTGVGGLRDGAAMRLLHAQRQFHGDIERFSPLIEQIMILEGERGMKYKNLQLAYSEELGIMIKSIAVPHFVELLPRIQFSHGSCTFASLERASIDENVRPQSMAKPAQGRDQLSVPAAVKAVMEQIIPVIKRSSDFIFEYFRVEESDSEGQVHDMLMEALADVRGVISRLSVEITDILDVISAVAALEDVQRKVEADLTRESQQLLTEFRGGLAAKLSKYTSEQMTFVQNYRNDAKRPGVLVPFAKFPTMVDRFQAALARSTTSNAVLSEIEITYKKISSSLFLSLEQVVQGNPKYAHVIRMENCYFFRQTVGTRDVPAMEDHLQQAHAMFEASTAQYLEGLLKFQFPHLMAFFGRVEELVASVGAQDVMYHEGRRNLEVALKRTLEEVSMSEALQAVHTRMRKHLSPDTDLTDLLWDRMCYLLFSVFSRYEELCVLCYKMKLSPSAAEVRKLACDVTGSSSLAEDDNDPLETSNVGQKQAPGYSNSTHDRLWDNENFVLQSPTSNRRSGANWLSSSLGLGSGDSPITPSSPMAWMNNGEDGKGGQDLFSKKRFGKI